MQLVINSTDFLSSGAGICDQLIVKFQCQRHSLGQLHIQLVPLLLPLLVLAESEDLLRLIDPVPASLRPGQIDGLGQSDV